jgi:hypothetical protein
MKSKRQNQDHVTPATTGGTAGERTNVIALSCEFASLESVLLCFSADRYSRPKKDAQGAEFSCIRMNAQHRLQRQAHMNKHLRFPQTASDLQVHVLCFGN